MDERELRIYQAETERIAKTAKEEMDRQEKQAKNILPNTVPRLALPGAPRFLSREQEAQQKELLNKREQVKTEAVKDIEKAIDRMPERATKKDKQSVRDGAYDILGIPPDQRPQDKAKEPERPRGIEHSKFYTPLTPSPEALQRHKEAIERNIRSGQPAKDRDRDRG